MSHLRVDVGVLSMADHVGALLEVPLHRLRGRAEVGGHTCLQNPGEYYQK